MTPQGLTCRPDGLELAWGDQSVTLSAKSLRGACRCAECEAARRAGRIMESGAVSLSGCVPIGHYAVRLHFGDGHDRGIYPWSYLRDLSLRELSRGTQVEPATS